MMAVTVAVLMSTYNGEKYLREQIESIINQQSEYKITLFVRDDGSQDSTCNILNQYQEKGKLKWKRGSNIGVGRSFITLLKENPGFDYYAYADQDDVWFPDKIQRAVDAIKDKNRPALYFANGEIVDKKLQSYDRNINRDIKDLKVNMETAICGLRVAQGCASLFNDQLAEVIQQHELPDNILIHDLATTMVCAMTGGEIVYDPIPSFKYRMHGENEVGMHTKSQLGVVGTIKNRIKIVFTKPKIPVAKKSEEALRVYGNVATAESVHFCKELIASENNWIVRAKLALSPKLKSWTKNVGLTWRIRMLMGNY